MTSTTRLVTVLACVLAAACSSDITGTRPPSPQSLQLPLTPDQVSADLVARGFAAAMADPAIRVAVRDAMRASLITEHKLHLNEFLATPAGSVLANAAAGKLAIASSVFANAVSQLPAMDFYLPSQVQRRTWSGGASVRVGYLLDGNGQDARAYNLAGLQSLVLNGMETAGSATFLIEAAERTSRRIGPQASVPGTVIEDANDGIVSGSMVEYLRDGTTKVTELADIYTTPPRVVAAPALSFLQNAQPENVRARHKVPGTMDVGDPCTENCIEPPPCEPTCGGGGGSAPVDTTYLHEIETIDVCDNGMCGQTNEFEWHTYYSSNSGATFANRLDVRLEGIPSTFRALVDYIAIYKQPGYGNDLLQSDVVETDTFSHSDQFEPSPRWDGFDDGVMKGEGGEKCSFPRYQNAQPGCTPEYIWQRMNQSMIWNAN